MNRKIKIITIIILLAVLLFFSCVTGDKYRTYRLDGIPLKHETTYILLSWISIADDDGNQEFKVINKTNNKKEFRIFNFLIGESIMGNKNEKTIWGEPYTLWMNFDIYDAKKIIVNKLIFRSKSKVIDILDNIVISYLTKKSYSDNSPFEGGLIGELKKFRSYSRFSEEELINFRNSGTIDVNNFNNESRAIEKIQFVYDNVDVNLKKDRFFTIECDITLDSGIEGIEPENYRFTAKFNRIQYAEEKMSLILYLFLKAVAKTW
jgi:hypothetical protein